MTHCNSCQNHVNVQQTRPYSIESFCSVQLVIFFCVRFKLNFSTAIVVDRHDADTYSLALARSLTCSLLGAATLVNWRIVKWRYPSANSHRRRRHDTTRLSRLVFIGGVKRQMSNEIQEYHFFCFCQNCVEYPRDDS